MPLGYKYVERDATKEVDWSVIGKNLTDMLTAENKAREDKKAAIDKATTEYGNKLAQAPQGEHIRMNEWALKYANDAQQARLLQDRLLKNGTLKLKDYTVQRQNLLDGTTQMFNLTKEYQDEYATKMKAYKNGELQSLTLDNMKDVEGFSNFLNTQPYINPVNYSLSVGKMVKNPDTGVMEMSQSPNDFTTVNSLRNRIKATYNKYDMQGNVKGFVDGLGTQIDAVAKLGSLYKTGTITSTLTQMKTKNLPAYTDFEKAETAALEARLGTVYDYTSVLTENIKVAPNGKPYEYTWDATKAKNNPNLLLKKIDENSGQITVDLTDKQRKDVVEHMRVEARLMYDEKTTIEESKQLSRNDVPDYIIKGREDKKEKEQKSQSLAENFANAIYGDQKVSSQGSGGFSAATGLQFGKTKTGLKLYGYDDKGNAISSKTINVNIVDENGISNDQDINRFASAVAEQYGIDKNTFIRNVNAYKNARYRGAKFNKETENSGFTDERPVTTAAATG